MPKPELDTRLVLGALIIKHMDRFTNEDTVAILAENPYMQCFCGFDSFQYKMPFDENIF
ncbi:MAG: transposase [Bacteroidetes bacterium]|jgi:hypothetical protein|nr:transposase [Bacteroidota bacterium]